MKRSTEWLRAPRRLMAVLLSLSFVAAISGAPQSEADGNVPAASEQDAMLATVRHYANQYISHLPDFTCLRVTQQFEAGRRGQRWRKGDTLQSKLIYVGGAEERSLELVNGKPPSPGRSWRRPLATEGEFGTLVERVFSESSAAFFTWHGWGEASGRRVAMFDFAIDGEHSTMRLSLTDLAHALVPYRGTISFDPQTGEIWEIDDEALNIPQELQTKSLSTSIHYGEVQIGGIRHLLPVSATVLMDSGTSRVRDEIEFRDYRKFQTDSTVIFTAGEPQEDRSKPGPQK